ncbi:sensor histidine kinase [Roseovarius sp. TE539]|uniref:sensor histidine kinase n=1 Tax=Roseovarius sp. TE539 TaxID=2249812 RepID=UPI000DDFE6FD|nr:HAMP domain-containing sensor histidine kinase [Roseovarius sp. TE539]RBI70907.1 sensor histidine kinase [Roseovarius sp. TE539]
MSLRLRLALAGAVAILTALGLAAFGLSQLFGAHVERRAVAEMGVQLDQVLAGLERGPDGLELARAPADPRFRRPYGGLYWQIEGPDGLQRSRSLWDSALDLPADTLGDGGVHVHRLPGPEGGALLVLERSVTLPARIGGGSARAAVAMAAAELDAARHAFMGDLAPYLGLLALVLTGAGWAQLGVGLRPLRGLGTRVAALRAGRAERMGEDWPQELRPVAGEIDALLAAREAETARARTRASDLAHGLKTPLQALMGEAARLREAGAVGQAEGIEDTARAMRRTVDRELARARTAARAGDASADAGEVAERLVAVLRRTPGGGRLDWWVDIPTGTRVALDPADLSEALGALAENAARHARNRVSVCAVSQDGRVLLSVTDDGPGIAPDRRAALPARHGRADESGAGLGLAIAAEIAEAAGGRLTLSDADPGLAATLELP